MEITRIGREFIFLTVVIISAGIQKSSSIQQSINDIVAKTGDNVTFTYINDTITNTDYWYWAIYKPKPETIYSRGDNKTSEPSKYNVTNTTNGSFNLTVYKVTVEDARSYSFYSSKTKSYSTANLVVIEPLIASVYPPNGVSTGQQINLTCLVEYGGPTTDHSNVKPLSPDQDPQLFMYLGTTQITDIPPGQQLIGTDDDTHSKSISVNRTVLATDAGKVLTCVVRTTKPMFELNSSAPLNGRYPTANVRIDYSYNTINASVNSSMTWGCCQVGDILNCTADGYPYPTISWRDEIGQPIPKFSFGNGFTAVKLVKNGMYTWNCSAINDLTTTTITRSITINTNGGSAEQSISGSGSIPYSVSLPMILLLLTLMVTCSNMTT